MPKLWSDTVDSHRAEVREAILQAAWSLAAASGPASVTMSQVAETAGVGRATLYKYFSDVQAILSAWHERQIEQHLVRLSSAGEHGARPLDRLASVLGAYADICRERAAHHQGPHANELATLLHGSDQVAEAQHRLHRLISEIIRQAAQERSIRNDVAPAELATYCLHALTAASRLSSSVAVRRLVDVVLSGLA
jgi:AcrR family transcriptional regulator